MITDSAITLTSSTLSSLPLRTDQSDGMVDDANMF